MSLKSTMFKSSMAATLKALSLAAVIGLAALSGCGQTQQSSGTVQKPPSQASQQWQAIANGFVEDYFRAQPFFAAQAGRHEYDGQLPDLSVHGIKREISRLHDARAQITAVDPAPLGARERFDREYLLNVIDSDLFWLEKARAPFTNPAWYLGNIDPDLYLSRNYAPLATRLKAYIRYAQGIPALVAAIQDNLKGPLPRTFVELAIDDFGGFVEFYAKEVTPVFASVADPDLQKQLADADTSASNAMLNLKNYFIGLRKTANDGFPLGKDLFSAMLTDTQGIDIPLEQIESVGRADLDRNTQALKAACDEYLPKATMTACIAKVSADKPKDGPVAAARLQLVELKKYVQEHDIVSIPSDSQALVAEAPIYNRSNSAFIQVPGPYDTGVTAIYNIAPPDPKWSKAEQAAYIPSVATLLSTSVHEVWPGHFLQFLHSNSDPDKLEALWVGYAFAEGWAHYCEEMMVEEGLVKDSPENHIGQITDALLRDVRLLSAIGLHTGGMTVAQSEKMFREQAFSDPGNARQQAARGTYDPEYLDYTLGKLMIRKLRSDWLAKTQPNAPAGDMSHWKEFHDLFLSYGGPPIPLLRKELVGGGSLL
jgi:uncharacterized protein (DUF885 family)